MTDHASSLPVRPMAIDAAAFRRASRHSRHVRLLRFVLMAGVVLLVGGIAVVTFVDPFHAHIEGVSIDGASLAGTKVTMANPKLSGYHKDGRPYDISASSAVQDIKTPTMFELHDLKARLTMGDKSVTSMSSDLGTYSSTEEVMVLTSAVHIVSDSGLDMHTQDARVEFKTSAVATDNPVVVTMRGNSVDADRMRVIDGGKQVTFEGHVHSVVLPGQQVAASDAPTPAGAP